MSSNIFFSCFLSTHIFNVSFVFTIKTLFIDKCTYLGTVSLYTRNIKMCFCLFTFNTFTCPSLSGSCFLQLPLVELQIPPTGQYLTLFAGLATHLHLAIVAAFCRDLYLKLICHEAFFPGNLHTCNTVINDVAHQPYNLTYLLFPNHIWLFLRNVSLSSLSPLK